VGDIETGSFSVIGSPLEHLYGFSRSQNDRRSNSIASVDQSHLRDRQKSNVMDMSQMVNRRLDSDKEVTLRHFFYEICKGSHLAGRASQPSPDMPRARVLVSANRQKSQRKSRISR
jgi:hypothetical protein